MSPSQESLPPFSGDEPTCPKCSHDQAYTEYKAAAEPPTGTPFSWGPEFPERLERRCARCDYQWNEALNPPAPKAGA